MLVFVLWLLGVVQSENTAHADQGEISLIEQIENHRVQAIHLLNDTDAYDMATAISENVADTLKFFDDLGTLFRNGTLATYICPENEEGKLWCNLYALPNGSVPLKKSVVKLMFDAYHMTLRKYGDPHLKERLAKRLVRNWFSSPSDLLASERQYELHYTLNLIDALHKDIISELWWSYNQLLVGYHGLQNMELTTWKNITKELRTDGTCEKLFETYLKYGRFESQSDKLLKVLDNLLGPHCPNESDANHIWDIRSPMKRIATTRNFYGGDSNRCFPEFLIRCTDYDEAIYKAFITDISTLIYHELTTVGLCLGMSPMNASGREQHRSRWSESVGAIMKKILDARSVLKEVPPSQAVDEKVANAVANVSANLASLLWKDRPAFYEKAIRNAVRNLKHDYDSSWSSIIGYDGNVDGVMYLPYKATNRGIHCASATTNGNYSGSIGDETNYFVKYTWQANINQTLEDFRRLRLYKNRILELAFAESDDDLCERVLVAIRDRRTKRNRRDDMGRVMEHMWISAFVAVRCAYDFVWYELGWRYYKAARTTSDYVLEQNDGTFNATCGQLIFLP